MNSFFKQTPDWVKQAVFYQIFPDRWRRSHQYLAPGRFSKWGEKPSSSNMMGGNLLGIVEKLDYLCDLGFNALYLCPIFASTSNHRYHTNDYFQIDPILGNLDHFDQLVREVHQRDMRLILDGVFNHCGRGLYQFNSLLEQGEHSPFVDWFHVKKWPLNAYGRGQAHYECWWDIPALPKFNTTNPEVREFLWSVASFWMNRGIDGWRLDVPNEINDDDFWREFRIRVKNINPEAYIVGEIWDTPDRWLQGDQFDAVMNYPARQAIIHFLFPERVNHPDFQNTGEPISSKQPLDDDHSIDTFSQEISQAFPAQRFGIPFNLLGSHDNARIASLAQGNPEKRELAWAILFMLPGTPCVYYGDELGMEGGKDPECRACFPWENLDSLKTQPDTQLIRDLIQFRRCQSPLWHGDFDVIRVGKGLILRRRDGELSIELQIFGEEPQESFATRTFILERPDWRIGV